MFLFNIKIVNNIVLFITNIFILQTNIIMAGNDSDLGRFRLWNRKEMTILAPVRVGIGIVFSSCWQNLSQNRLELKNCK